MELLLLLVALARSMFKRHDLRNDTYIDNMS